MSVPIRELLNELAEGDPEAIARLRQRREVGRGEGPAACQALARSYQGDHRTFLEDLRRADLVLLLSNPTWIEDAPHYLPNAGRFSRDELLAIASKAFTRGWLPSEFEPWEELEEIADEEDGDLEGLQVDHRSPAYREAFVADLAYSRAAAQEPLRDYQREALETLLREVSAEQPKLLQLATGGGKTRVANDVAARWADAEAGPVLWITKDWRLLKQAAQDVARRYQGIRLTRLGGDGGPLQPLEDSEGGRFVYTTIQTMVRRLGRLGRMRPKLIVWDECHWGEHGRARRILTSAQRLGIPVLGLTATPRHDTTYEVAYSKTFLELVEAGWLAAPKVREPVRTGVRWSPQFRLEEVTQASLRELAENDKRNELIVEAYRQNLADYGKAIVFACTIDHVDRLTRLFCARGIPARAVHNELGASANQQALEAFKRNAVKVLVNVEMLTHGIDVPDVKTVFLCRPTASDILFAQMIGRASRRDDATGKTWFNVVEFTDNVASHGDLFQTAQRHFQGAGIPSLPRRPADGVRTVRPRHNFDPKGAPTWIPDDPSLADSVRGLWYRQGQTFGIEFELTTADGSEPPEGGGRKWMKIAKTLRDRLAVVLGDRVAPAVLAGYEGSGGDKDTSRWNIEPDSSAGWEVTTRVLADLEGFLEVDAACRVLDAAAAELGLKVNYRTGTHVHLGWLGRGATEVVKAIRFARLFEPAVASLVAPSRIVDYQGSGYDVRTPNDYCRPVSQVFTDRKLSKIRNFDDLWTVAGSDSARRVTFNVKPLESIHTVEVRLHSGTLEARKILLWVSLWQQILWAAQHRTEAIPVVPDRKVIVPTEDIVRLAVTWLPDARQPEQVTFLRKLEARRAEIREQWQALPELAPWVEAAKDWATVDEAVA